MSRSSQHPPSTSWRAGEPYNALPELPPPIELETKAILKQCIRARAALGELKQTAELILDQAILIRTLPLLEAQASSEIENIITTIDRLFQYRDVDDEADPATKEALRYSQALLEGFQLIRSRPLNTRTAEEICTLIKGMHMQIRRIPGTALARQPTGKVVYTPPVGEELLRKLLANWERFLHENQEIDPLIRMAVGHYQFEAIHPFTDGNGRTGRILNSLFLISENLLTLPILYLSRYLIEHKSDYYRLLLQVTQSSAWDEWVMFLLRGIEETARWTIDKIAAIRELQALTVQYVRRNAEKIYSHELINLIFELPYCRIASLTERQRITRQTASSHLKTLVQLGVLEEVSRGREKLFIHSRLLQLLTSDSNEIAPYP